MGRPVHRLKWRMKPSNRFEWALLLLSLLQFVAMSASIFMTVGIALERYIAVHYPIGKEQGSPRARALNLLLEFTPSSKKKLHFPGSGWR